MVLQVCPGSPVLQAGPDPILARVFAHHDTDGPDVWIILST